MKIQVLGVMATLLRSKLRSLKLATEKRLVKKYHKKVVVMRHKDSLVELSLVELSVSLEKTSSFYSGDISIFNDDNDSSCNKSTKSPHVHDTTSQCCLVDTSSHLTIPQHMKSEYERQSYCLEYVNEMHCYWKVMESNAVFPVDSGVLSKQSQMTNRHYSIVTDWMIGVQEGFQLLNDTLYIAVNLMNQYFKVCIFSR